MARWRSTTTKAARDLVGAGASRVHQVQKLAQQDKVPSKKADSRPSRLLTRHGQLAVLVRQRGRARRQAAAQHLRHRQARRQGLHKVRPPPSPLARRCLRSHPLVPAYVRRARRPPRSAAQVGTGKNEQRACILAESPSPSSCRVIHATRFCSTGHIRSLSFTVDSSMDRADSVADLQTPTPLKSPMTGEPLTS